MNIIPEIWEEYKHGAQPKVFWVPVSASSKAAGGVIINNDFLLSGRDREKVEHFCSLLTIALQGRGLSWGCSGPWTLPELVATFAPKFVVMDFNLPTKPESPLTDVVVIPADTTTFGDQEPCSCDV